jgi:sugar phosphate isomerase/epimerase
MLIGAMNHPARDPLEELAWMADHGRGYIDLTIEPPAAAADRIDVAAFAKALSKHGMGVVGHTAFYAPIASGVERIRRAAVDELVAALEVFAKLGARWVNIHPDGHTHFFERQGNVERNLQSLRTLVDAARRLGTNVMVENVPGMYNDAEQLAELLDPFPVEDLGLLLDIGHTNLRVPPKTNTAGEIIARLGDRIRHVHLHDNYGGEPDLHLPLGVGHVPFREVLAQLKATGYDATITLEVFAPDKRYFAMSRDILRDAWDAA